MNEDKNNGTPRPLSERVKVIASEITRRVRAEKVAGAEMPASDQGFCVICRSPRLDRDPTGVTCGNPACLAELGENFGEQSSLRSEIRELAKKNDIRFSTQEEVILDRIEEKLNQQKEVDDKLINLACIMGVDVKDKALLNILEEVLLQVEKIDQVVKTIESKTPIPKPPPTLPPTSPTNSTEHIEDPAPDCDVCGRMMVHNNVGFKCINCGNIMSGS